jgi:hypothetical protein
LPNSLIDVTLYPNQNSRIYGEYNGVGKTAASHRCRDFNKMIAGQLAVDSNLFSFIRNKKSGTFSNALFISVACSTFIHYLEKKAVKI